MNRVTHLLFGEGTVIESKTTESGKSVRLVRFDSSDTDRLILADSLKPSKSSAPVAASPKTRRKKASPKSEEVSDALLVPDLDEALLRPPDSVLEEYEEA